MSTPENNWCMENGDLETVFRRYGLGRNFAPGERRIRRAALLEGFCQAIAESGPVLAHFGSYLASRVDLIGVEDAEALATIRDLDQPSDAGERQVQILRQRLDAGSISLELDQRQVVYLPDASNAIVAEFDAIAEGRRLGIRMLRHPRDAAWERQCALVDQTSRVLLSLWPEIPVVHVCADFKRALERELEVRLKLSDGSDVGTEDESGFAVPVSYAEDAFSDIWVYAADEHLRLSSSQVANPVELARRICLHWLYSAFGRSWLPVGVSVPSLGIGEGNRLMFLGGETSALNPKVQLAMCDYLYALASDDSAQACALLGDQLVRTNVGPYMPEELQPLFAQIEAEGTTERLHGQMRAVALTGQMLNAQVLDFYRGLSFLTRSVRDLAPDTDVLKDVLHEYRLLTSISEAMKLAHMDQFLTQSETFIRYLTELPGKIEQVTVAKERQARTPDSTSRSQAGRSDGAIAGLALGLAGVGLCLSKFNGPWLLERVFLCLFGAIGIALLATIFRTD